MADTITLPRADYEALVTAAAEALALMQALGWRHAAETEGLTDDQAVEAIAAEAAYHNLRAALPIPARFAAEVVKDPMNITRKEAAGD